MLILSLLVHLPLVYSGGGALMGDGRGGGEPRYFEVTPVVRDLDDDEIQEEERQADEEYDPPEELPEGDVVDSQEAGEERRPEDPRYLAARDQVVERQTRARVQRRGEPSPTSPPSTPPSSGASAPERPERSEQMLAGLLNVDQGLRPSDQGERPSEQAPPPGPPSPLNLSPSLNAMSDAVGGGLDDLDDEVDEGQRTLLDTARWRHAPFFQRVRHQVAQYWHPDVAFLRHDPGGHVYGYRDRETVVRVVLDERGALERAYILSASGAQFLDNEAVRAIEQAAPFTNPPQGLIDQETRRIVFTFGFTVELGERPIFRLRRYR